MTLKQLIAGLLAGAAVLAGSCTTSVPEQEAAAVVQNAAADFTPYTDKSAFKAAYRRLTESQYRHTIADIFGEQVQVNARFEPEQRMDGLLAIGNAQASISTSGLEQYVSVANAIAEQVIEGEGRDARIGCQPADDMAAGEACATRFIRTKGALLFRRPLSEEETKRRVDVWKAGASDGGGFHKGLKLSLVTLLVAPEFLFRTERAEQDPANPDGYRLDAYSKAMRLSYTLWDTAPDTELLQAAYSGDIHTEEGYQRQVDRLLASPRLADGVRAFFEDMLHFEVFDNMVKDAATYPQFSQAVSDGAREETLRFLVEHLVVRKEDYRTIFTTQDTVFNRTLASVYNVPFASSEPWSKYTFDEDAGRSGILTQVTFLSLFSHPAASSPTIRGVKLYEIFMCVKTPDPPADVDFSKVQAMASGTVRTRLIAHMTNPGCASCHQLSDPVGLALEKFDGIGQWRTHENGVPIDVSGEIGGKSFSGAQGVGQYLHDSPMPSSCLVRNMYYYGQGRTPDHTEQRYLTAQTEAFANGGYRLPDLYRNIVLSPEFLKVSRPKTAAPAPAGTASIQQQAQSGE